MPFFLPAVAAVATVVLAKKLVARAWNEHVTLHATADPPGIRTVAAVELEPGADPTALLCTIAAEVSRDLPETLEVTADAVRVRSPDERSWTEIVRMAPRATAWVLELTRAWTNIPLDDHAKRTLMRIDAALRDHPATRQMAWYARQDRGCQTPHQTPFD